MTNAKRAKYCHLYFFLPLLHSLTFTARRVICDAAINQHFGLTRCRRGAADV